MKNKLFLTLLVVSLLAGCGATPSNSDEVSTSTSLASEVSSQDSAAVTSEVISYEDEDELPPPAGSQDSGEAELGNITFDKVIPSGWLYTGNSAEYPNPEFYTDGGLKLNFPVQSLKSPVYATAVNSVKITGKLNKNTRTVGDATTLKLYKIDGQNETEVGSLVFSEVGLTTYDKTFTITGGATQFVIKMTANVGYNVNLNTITLG